MNLRFAQSQRVNVPVFGRDVKAMHDFQPSSSRAWRSEVEGSRDDS
jgi:hypothetical protein